ncbi:spindle and kinetochore-associated protein 1 homolog [Selaginella moellendorffii]|nr:spindle and kinetochore-associated protein 1 homolog [Selaginella moellendorffii]|eukprot:XP_002966226.2 spindle and kinetochore-associated protein 1 homolog [Selaginella moellendorffii]
MALEKIVSAFTRRISDLQELMVLRGDGRAADMSAVDVSLKAVEQDFRKMDSYVKSEMEALSKAKALSELTIQQTRKIQAIVDHFPSTLPAAAPSDALKNRLFPVPEKAAAHTSNILPVQTQNPKVEKEKKGKGLPPRKYVSDEEFASLSSYMRGRITLDKVNSAIDEMAGFAENNLRLIQAPRKKLGDDILEKVLELRDIAGAETIKGKHFFLESDMRGPLLKMDTTGKAILTIIRHLGRVLEARIGKQRVFALLS